MLGVIQRLLLAKTYTDLVSTFEVKHGHGQLWSIIKGINILKKIPMNTRDQCLSIQMTASSAISLYFHKEDKNKTMRANRAGCAWWAYQW